MAALPPEALTALATACAESGVDLADLRTKAGLPSDTTRDAP